MTKRHLNKKDSMVPIAYLWIGVIAAATSLVLAGIVAQASASGSGGVKANTPTVVPTDGSTEPIQPPSARISGGRIVPDQPGGRAIQPHITPKEPLSPAFTAQDVIDYVRTHPHGDSMGDASAITVERVDFLLRGELEQRFPGLRTYVPNNTLICVVTLRGTFQVSAPPLLQQRLPNASSDTAYQLFDAQTGNILTETVGKPSGTTKTP